MTAAKAAIPVQFEAALSGIVDGEGGALGAQVRAGIGASHRDPWHLLTLEVQGVLLGRPEEMARGLFIREDTSVASA